MEITKLSTTETWFRMDTPTGATFEADLQVDTVVLSMRAPGVPTLSAYGRQKVSR